jgi:hypothetical protein
MLKNETFGKHYIQDEESLLILSIATSSSATFFLCDASFSALSYLISSDTFSS